MNTYPATQINGHKQRCQCSECYDLIRERFRPFDCCPFESHLRSVEMPCPQCNRSCVAAARGGWCLWACWECLHQVAEIAKLSKNDFGFAEDKHKNLVYFHFNRQLLIKFDGSDFARLENREEKAPFATEDEGLRVGEIIVYQELIGDLGPKALWWAFDRQHVAALMAIKQRHLYRFRLRDGREKISKLHPTPVYKELWQGKNLMELRLRLRKSEYPTFGSIHDHRARYFEFFDEAQQAWVECADPR